MTFVQTMISSAVGARPFGKPAPNKPDDVKKVQGLISKVLGVSALAVGQGVCDEKTKTAIVQFQKFWGAPDGIVDPGGQTLKRLDRLANGLVLKPIQMGRVASGGYLLGFTTCDGGPLPTLASGYTLHLCFVDQSHSIEVTGRSAHDLLGADNLGAVLRLFDKLNAWATTLPCFLQLRYHGGLVSESQPQLLVAPVRPHNGRMLPLDELNNGPVLTYQGSPAAKEFHGRMFEKVPGFDNYVFTWAGKFETNTDHRGFDCITYVGTTCAAPNQHMASSPDLAAALGANAVTQTTSVKDPASGQLSNAEVTLDEAAPAVVKEFFASKPSGYFLMWSGGHIVLVANGFVHEFKPKAGSGYACTPVAQWLEPYKSVPLTVRRLPSRPARAS